MSCSGFDRQETCAVDRMAAPARALVIGMALVLCVRPPEFCALIGIRTWSFPFCVAGRRQTD